MLPRYPCVKEKPRDKEKTKDTISGEALRKIRIIETNGEKCDTLPQGVFLCIWERKQAPDGLHEQ